MFKQDPYAMKIDKEITVRVLIVLLGIIIIRKLSDRRNKLVIRITADI